MNVPGPLSFRLMIFSIAAYVLTCVLAALLGPFSALIALGGFLLSIASVTCAVYEFKNQPGQKLYSMIAASVSGTIIVIFSVFMLAVFFTMGKPQLSQEPKKISSRSYGSEYQ